MVSHGVFAEVSLVISRMNELSLEVLYVEETFEVIGNFV